MRRETSCRALPVADRALNFLPPGFVHGKRFHACPRVMAVRWRFNQASKSVFRIRIVLAVTRKKGSPLFVLQSLTQRAFIPPTYRAACASSKISTALVAGGVGLSLAAVLRLNVDIYNSRCIVTLCNTFSENLAIE